MHKLLDTNHAQIVYRDDITTMISFSLYTNYILHIEEKAKWIVSYRF